LTPYLGYEQKVNWENSATAVAAIQLDSGSGPSAGTIYDRMMGDIKINNTAPLISNRANPEEFRFIRVSDFRWIETKEIGFLPNVAGGKLHENHNGDGDLLASHSVIVNYMCNLGAADISSMGVINDLSFTALF
jgi:hypothetical protein